MQQGNRCNSTHFLFGFAVLAVGLHFTFDLSPYRIFGLFACVIGLAIMTNSGAVDSTTKTTISTQENR